MITREELLTRAAYNHAIFGDSKVMIPDAPNDYVIERLTRERSPDQVRAVLQRGQSPAGHCNGNGYIWHFDTDYPCGGCARCRPTEAMIGWTISAFFWHIATGAERARLEETLRGFEALTAIGRAIEAAGSPARGVSAFVQNAIHEWNQVRVDRFYVVHSRRGSAKTAYGMVGEVCWLGETTYERAGHTTTRRAGLKVEGSDKPIYVPASTLAPIVPPAEILAKRAAEAAAAEEQKLRASVQAPFPQCFVARKNVRRYTAGIIVTGTHVGKRGRVFWMGEKKSGLRVGVDVGEAAPVWCAANDVIPEPTASELPAHIAADGTVVSAVEIIEHYVVLLSAIGCDAEALQWAAKMATA